MIIYCMIKETLTLYYIVPPIRATLFISPLFFFSINLVADKDEDGFGMDDTSNFKKKLLFILFALQFIPVLISLYFMIILTSGSQDLRIVQFIANLFLLVSVMVLKFGTYKKKDQDSF